MKDSMVLDPETGLYVEPESQEIQVIKVFGEGEEVPFESQFLNAVGKKFYFLVTIEK